MRDGRLLALAVSARDRASGFPDVPTPLEAGFAERRLRALARRVLAGENAARHRRAAASTKCVKALQSPALRERLAGLDVEPMPMTPAEFDAFIKDEVVAQGALAKAAGLKPNQ